MKGFLNRIFSLDLRSLALFRMALGALMLLDLCLRAPYIEAHYTDLGILPLEDWARDYGHWTAWSFHVLSGEAPLQIALFVLHGILAILMIVGFQTRIVTPLVWILLCSLQLRCRVVLQGGDDLIRLLFFWAMFLPIGERWSFDAARKKEAPKARVTSFATAALMFQIFYVYWCTAALKRSPVWWPNGTAVELALGLDAYATPLGKWLLALGHKLPFLLPFMTFSTLAFEYLGPLLALSPYRTGPVRTFTVIAFIVMHVGFGLTLEIGLFWLISIAGWLALLPGWFWDELLPRVTKRQTVPGVGEPRPSPRIVSGFVILCFAYVTLWNVRGLDWMYGYKRVERVFPTSMNPVASILRLDQFWTMFAPAPPDLDGWFLAPAFLEDGSEVDIFGGGGKVSYEPPPLISATYPSQRWRKMLLNVGTAGPSPMTRNYLAWLVRRYEREHPGRVQSARLLMMREQPAALHRRVLLATYRPEK